MNLRLIETFRGKLAEGVVVGPFMKTCDPAFVEASGYAGFDFAILDMEHGPASLKMMENNVRAAQISGLLPVIRVRDKDPETISQALDIGAAGIQIPQIRNASEVREVVSSARFYPHGERGVCRFVRAAHYSSMERNEYFAAANQMLLILQLEGEEAISNIDEIISENGYDVLFVGPYDLSQSLGVPGDVTNPIVVDAISGIVEKARSHGKVVGLFVDRIDTALFWKSKGVQYLSYSVDVGIYTDICLEITGKLH